jgi:hypothetical protein
MSVPPPELAAIAEAIKQYLSQPGPDPLGIRDAARRLDLLPVVRNWDECLALTRDGQVASFGYVADAAARPVAEGRKINQVHLQASLRVPGLRTLAPVRPAGALDCPFCGGTGTATEVTQNDPELGFCYCGGVGWLPADDPQTRGGEPSAS